MSAGNNPRGVSRIVVTFVLVAMLVVAGIALYVTLNPPNTPTTTHVSTRISSRSNSTITITLNPTVPLIAPGQIQNYSWIQVAGNAPNGTIVMAVTAPPGLSFLLSMTSVSLSGNPQSIPLVLKAAPSLPTGKYLVTIEVSSAVVPAENETFSVDVVPALVILQGLAFHPQNMTVPKSTTVTWINLDSSIGCCDPGYHTVVFVSGANASSPQLNRFDTWSYNFNAVGQVNYFCSIHPYMKGEVTLIG